MKKTRVKEDRVDAEKDLPRLLRTSGQGNTAGVFELVGGEYVPIGHFDCYSDDSAARFVPRKQRSGVTMTPLDAFDSFHRGTLVALSREEKVLLGAARSTQPEPEHGPKPSLKGSVIQLGDYADAKDVHIKVEARAVTADNETRRVFSNEITIPMTEAGFEAVTHELAELYVISCQRILKAIDRRGKAPAKLKVKAKGKSR